MLPALARGLIDHNLSTSQAESLSHYYLLFVAAAAVLGLSSATRFYFVTWLGERVVADVRKAVFDNVLGLTPAFFEVTRTGEVLSRLTADTTLIQTVVGSSVSVALRSMVTLVGGLTLMFITSLKLALLVVGAVVLVMVPHAAVRALGADLVAQEPGFHRRNLRARRRNLERRFHGAGLHPGKIRARRIRRDGGNRLSPSPAAAPWRAPS